MHRGDQREAILGDDEDRQTQKSVLASERWVAKNNGRLTNISDGGTNFPQSGMSYEYDSAGRRAKRTLQSSTFESESLLEVVPHFEL